jgi:hypothetical protein
LAGEAEVSIDSYIEKLEQRINNLEDVVALQSELILELNKTIAVLMKSGPAASEGIPVTNGKAAGPQ